MNDRRPHFYHTLPMASGYKLKPGDIIGSWRIIEPTTRASTYGAMQYIMACCNIRDGEVCNRETEQTSKQARNHKMCMSCGTSLGTRKVKGCKKRLSPRLLPGEQRFLDWFIARHRAACAINDIPLLREEAETVAREATDLIVSDRADNYAYVKSLMNPQRRERETRNTTALGRAMQGPPIS